MTDREFWATQPKRLKALLAIQEQVSNGNNNNTPGNGARHGFIDQVL